jgi:hypothetical protein
MCVIYSQAGVEKGLAPAGIKRWQINGLKTFCHITYICVAVSDEGLQIPFGNVRYHPEVYIRRVSLLLKRRKIKLYEKTDDNTSEYYPLFPS